MNILITGLVALAVSLSGCWISLKDPGSTVGELLKLLGQIIGVITLFYLIRIS